MLKGWVTLFVILANFTAYLAGCSPAPASTQNSGSQTGDKLNVVATTTIVGDVVRNVGGDSISLNVLLPFGMDPHSFHPSPKDMAKVADAQLIIMSGAGLEDFMTPLLENSGGKAVVIDASQGISLLKPSGSEGHEGGDPHVWMDPNNVKTWVRNIETALSKEDPTHAAFYQSNAKTYLRALEELDAWVQFEVGQIPKDRRDLVTDHQVLGYFATRYGFQQIGALIPSYSTAAEPSAQELAALEDSVRKLRVKAIFVGNTVNPSLAQRVAEDTSTQLVFILTGSLTEKGGLADSYLDYLRYNISAIVEALK